MPMDDMGFLGEDIKKVKADIEAKYKDIFDLCRDINAFAQRTKYKFQVHSKDLQEIVVASLFIKLLNGFQAMVILAPYGLTIEAVTLMRSILETLFVLKAVAEDPDYVTNYIKTDEANRLKLMNTARNNPNMVLDELRAYATDERGKGLKEKIDKEKIRELELKTLADKAGMGHIYDTMYRVLSGTSHPTPRAIEEYANLDDNKELIALTWGPREEDVPKDLISSVGIVIIGMEVMMKMFKVEQTGELEALRRRSDELAGKYLKE